MVCVSRQARMKYDAGRRVPGDFHAELVQAWVIFVVRKCRGDNVSSSYWFGDFPCRFLCAVRQNYSCQFPGYPRCDVKIGTRFYMFILQLLASVASRNVVC